MYTYGHWCVYYRRRARTCVAPTRTQINALYRSPSPPATCTHLAHSTKDVELVDLVPVDPIIAAVLEPHQENQTCDDVHTTGVRRAEKGSSWRGLRRSLRGFERDPDGSNAGRPAGESNPIAWPKPEARYRSRAAIQLQAHSDSNGQRQQGRCAAIETSARTLT